MGLFDVNRLQPGPAARSRGPCLSEKLCVVAAVCTKRACGHSSGTGSERCRRPRSPSVRLRCSSIDSVAPLSACIRKFLCKSHARRCLALPRPSCLHQSARHASILEIMPQPRGFTKSRHVAPNAVVEAKVGRFAPVVAKLVGGLRAFRATWNLQPATRPRCLSRSPTSSASVRIERVGTDREIVRIDVEGPNVGIAEGRTCADSCERRFGRFKFRHGGQSMGQDGSLISRDRQTDKPCVSLCSYSA